ncbi:MAG: ankyrin repeat domain-containing protein, partial [Planctomycetota bacterium]
MLSFDGNPLPLVVGYLREVTPVAMSVVKKDLQPPDAPVTISAETTLEHALALICWQTDLAWTVEDGAVRVGKPESLKANPLVAAVPAVPPRLRRALCRQIDLDFHEMPLPTALEFVAHASGLPLVWHPQDIESQVSPPLTMQFSGPANLGLGKVCWWTDPSLFWTVEGPIVKLGTLERLSEGLGRRNPLHAAAKAGILASIRHLLKKGADANSYDPEGYTPLFPAAREGHEEVVKLLLAHGADPNTPGLQDNQSPLLAALWSNHEETAELLLQAGADPNVQSRSGARPLRTALLTCGPNLIRSLLAAGADPNAGDEYGCTPLHVAALDGVRIDAAEALLAAGANPDAQDHNGEAPLHFAVRAANEKAARLLIASGADVDLKNAKGKTALAVVAEWCPHREEFADLLLSNGADPQAVDEEGWTPLLRAAWLAAIERTIQQREPVHEMMAALGYLADADALLKTFLEHRVEPDIIVACMIGDAERVTAVLARTPQSTNARGNSGHTPLYAACWAGHEDLAERLVALGAHVNGKSIDGRTALHAAAIME